MKKLSLLLLLSVSASCLAMQTGRLVSLVRRGTHMVGVSRSVFVPVRGITNMQTEEYWEGYNEKQELARTGDPKKLFANTATVLESMVEKSGQSSEQPDPQTSRRIKVSLEALKKEFGQEKLQGTARVLESLVETSRAQSKEQLDYQTRGRIRDSLISLRRKIG